jgi:hypothetical protein
MTARELTFAGKNGVLLRPAQDQPRRDMHDSERHELVFDRCYTFVTGAVLGAM